jgi:UDP-GlcNAc:undecaprenyl-phosphate GlcNAc-1-phosphate transferase
MSYLLGFLLAAALSTALIPLLVQLAGPLGLMDQPGGRKVHERPVARVGGIAIAIGVLAPALLWVPPSRQVLAYLVGAGILLGLGVVDDRVNLGYREKFAGQIAAALVVILWGGVIVSEPPFCGQWLGPVCAEGHWSVLIAVPVTLLTIVGVTNAINLSDGLDGLAGGTTLLTIGMVAMLALEGGDAPVALLGIVLTGALLGFLRYNTYPARVFMGDAGSQLLGYSAAVLAILVTQKSQHALSPALPLLLLAMPIADTLAVMAQRIAEGRSPFSPDRNHLHHRLLALGLTHHEAVFLIYAWQVAIVVAAYLLRYRSDTVVVAAGLFFGLAPVAALQLAGARGWRVGGEVGQGTWLARLFGHYRGRGLPGLWGLWTLRLLLPLAIAGAVVLAGPVSPDLGAVAGLAFLVMVAGLIGGRGYLLSLGLYVGAALFAYLLKTADLPSYLYRDAVNAGFIALGLAIALRLRFATGRDLFRVNPLDFLVVLLALLVPPVLREIDPGLAIGGFMVKFLLLAYAGEVLLAREGPDRRLVTVAGLVGTLLLGLRAAAPWITPPWWPTL